MFSETAGGCGAKMAFGCWSNSYQDYCPGLLHSAPYGECVCVGWCWYRGAQQEGGVGNNRVCTGSLGVFQGCSEAHGCTAVFRCRLAIPHLHPSYPAFLPMDHLSPPTGSYTQPGRQLASSPEQALCISLGSIIISLRSNGGEGRGASGWLVHLLQV